MAGLVGEGLKYVGGSLYKGYLSLSKQEQAGASTAAFLYMISHDVKAAELPESSQRIEFESLLFEVEKAKTVEGLVHIRSCDNCKYWVRESAYNELIVAEANEPEEDQSKWSCTLFKPVFLDTDDDSNPKKMQLLHVSQHREGTMTLNDQFQLAVGYFRRIKHPFFVAVFNIVDAGPAVRLPKYVAFKGPNGRYLTLETDFFGKTRLLFKSSDIGEKGVAQRISYSSSNDFKTMYIIDQGTGSHWTINPRKRGVTVGPQKMATSFYPIKVGNYIALRCLSTNKFAKGTPTADNNSDVTYLTSDAPTISMDAYLTVEEPVHEREIIDATYNLDKSKIYNPSIIEKYIDARSNHTNVDQKGTFQVQYKVSKTMSWNQSTTIKLGIKATWSAGIPRMGKGGVEISYENSSTWAWGEQQTEEKTVLYLQDIIIPPRKRVTLTVLLQKAWCDVPFSCKVRDRMTWGELREYEVTDGLYKGSNVFHLDTKIIDEDLETN